MPSFSDVFRFMILSRGIIYKHCLYKKLFGSKSRLYWRCQDRKCCARLTTAPPPALTLLNESGTHTCGLVPVPMSDSKSSFQSCSTEPSRCDPTQTARPCGNPAPPRGRLPGHRCFDFNGYQSSVGPHPPRLAACPAAGQRITVSTGMIISLKVTKCLALYTKIGCFTASKLCSI